MPKYYLIDDDNNLVEGFDKEAFLALLQQAIDDKSLESIDPDSAVASKLRSNLNGTTHHIEFVTQAQYNQLVADGKIVANTYYIITDDETAEDIDAVLNDHAEQLENHAEELAEHEERLDALGFKEGVATSSYIGFTSQSLMKQGKMALFNMVSASQINVPTSGDKYITIAFPTDFKPQDDTQVRIISTAIRNLAQFTVDIVGTLETDGVLYITLPHNSQYATTYFGFSIVNAGWRLK